MAVLYAADFSSQCAGSRCRHRQASSLWDHRAEQPQSKQVSPRPPCLRVSRGGHGGPQCSPCL